LRVDTEVREAVALCPLPIVDDDRSAGCVPECFGSSRTDPIANELLDPVLKVGAVRV